MNVAVLSKRQAYPMSSIKRIWHIAWKAPPRLTYFDSINA